MNKNMYESPVKFANLIDYQKDAVVSKTIIKKDVGTVTLFAFDKNQAISTHSAPFDALVFIVDGIAQITVDEKVNVLEKDQMIIMPKDIPHGVVAKQNLKMVLVMIKA